MCNAWNHPPGCSCGWGGGNNSGGYGGGLGFLGGRSSLSQFVIPTRSAFQFPPPSAARAAIGHQPTEIREAETRETTCWWCGATVFYHTNGYGDCVLFDSLGAPWAVHRCWADYWDGQKALRQGCSTRRPDNIDQIWTRIERYEGSGQTSTYRDLGGRPAQSAFHQRMAILAGAISQSRFIPDETTVARLLGISLQQLRSSYGDLYTINRSTNGIKLRSIDALKERQEKAKPATSTKNPKPVVLEIRRSRVKSNPTEIKTQKSEAKQQILPKKPGFDAVVARPHKPAPKPKKRTANKPKR